MRNKRSSRRPIDKRALEGSAAREVERTVRERALEMQKAMAKSLEELKLTAEERALVDKLYVPAGLDLLTTALNLRALTAMGVNEEVIIEHPHLLSAWLRQPYLL